ncbi:hypothetical protein COA01_34470 [Bacillus cereus]|nr:hypothetical protein COA01_34470 [Bacillus cereus]
MRNTKQYLFNYGGRYVKKFILIIVFLGLFGGLIYFMTPQSENSKHKPTEQIKISKMLQTYNEEKHKADLYGDNYVLWLNEANSKTLNPDNIDSITKPNKEKNKYENHFFGYQFSYPSNWLVDNHQASSYTRFFTKDFRVDIFVQDVKKAWTSSDGYISSTIKTLKPYITSDTEWSQNGYSIRKIDYNRPLIKGIKNDLNYYSYYFITEGKLVYTFQVKTKQELLKQTNKQMTELVSDFKTTTPIDMNLNEKVKAFNKNPDVMLQHKNKTLNIPKNHFMMGVYMPKPLEIKELESFSQNHIGAQMFYKPVNSDYDIYVEQLVAENRLPMVTFLFEKANSDEQQNVTMEILNGEFDSNFLSWVNGIKKTEAPVFLRLGNEMNGKWSAWSHKNIYNDPDLYKLSFKHITDIFRKNEVENAYFVWNPNNFSAPYFEWNEGAVYYPGDNYVDFVGMTSYNFGKTKWNDFQSIEDLYEDLYWNYSRSFFAKPLIIGEFGSVEYGGDKAQWILDVFNKIPSKYPNIKAAFWFDETHGKYNLKIKTSPESANAFKEGMNKDGVIKSLQDTKIAEAAH